MNLNTAEAIYEQIVRPLPVAERLRLMEKITQDLTDKVGAQEPKPKRSWFEIRGMVQHPMCGEDAQAWVTRTRRESDEASPVA